MDRAGEQASIVAARTGPDKADESGGTPRNYKVAVLGASGNVGRRIVARLLQRGYAVACQTRDASKLAVLCGPAAVSMFDPLDAQKLDTFVRGQDVIVFALGIDTLGATTLFSDVTASLIAAMRAHGVKRLVAITGIGAGDTRGHGGAFYDWFVFPFFTRHRYADKDRQEALIAQSGFDWIIVRPAPFTDKQAATPFEVHTTITPKLALRSITRDEVAEFVVRQLASDDYLGKRPFIGHR